MYGNLGDAVTAAFIAAIILGVVIGLAVAGLLWLVAHFALWKLAGAFVLGVFAVLGVRSVLR